MANLCRRKLEQAGHEVILADDGATAIRKALESAPDLLMLDLMMPGVDGFGVLQFLRSNDALSETPVIVVSNSGSLTDTLTDVDYPGRLAYFEKGKADFPTLLKKIETLVHAPTGGDNTLPPAKKSPDSITPGPVSANLPQEAQTEAKPAILIADDDSVMQQLISYILSGKGYTVSSAYDGQQALDKARDHPPKLLILDCAMPGLDGFGVMQIWNKDPELSLIPVIMLTADVDSSTRAEAIGKGVVAFLNKPFSPTDLLAHVKRFAGHPENP